MAYQVRDILQGLWSDPERQRCLRLAKLWSSWPEIVGHDIADLAKPLGHNKSTLLLGVDDPMAMQEMHFQAGAILEATNAALGENFFDKVRLDLLSGRSSLDAMASTLVEGREVRSQSSFAAFQNAGVKVEDVGGNVGKFSAIPALERCYKAYVNFLSGARTSKKHDQ